MINLILFILIGLKLNMMNGLFLALIIIDIVLSIIRIILAVAKVCLKAKGYGDD